jgi:endonuclease YncB( thermonuclease family)
VTLWSAAAFLGTAYGAGWLGDGSTSKPVALIDNTSAMATPLAPIDVDDATAYVAPVDVVPVDAPVTASFSLCHTGGGYNCVVDGDTIWFKGQNIRIADIDTPETHEPRCPGELALGNQATTRLHQLVNTGTVSLEPIDRDEDGYGRKLRIVEVDGVSVGDTLVREGLARWYEGGRRPWC